MSVFAVCVVVAGAAGACFVLIAAAIFVDAVAWPWGALLWPLGVWAVAAVGGLSSVALRLIRGKR